MREAGTEEGLGESQTMLPLTCFGCGLAAERSICRSGKALIVNEYDY